MPARVKKRLDVVLVEQGLAESRSQAQALVLAGLVAGYDKPGTQVDENAELEVERAAAIRLARRREARARARRASASTRAGADALDVGASTGGFTDSCCSAAQPASSRSTSATDSSHRGCATIRG